MAEAARRRGYSYLALTDHTASLAIARGLSLERVEMQRAVVASLNRRFEAEEADGTAPAETSPEGFRLLHGCELEVRADATLDYPDELLARYDLVVASVHVARRQTRDQLTARTLAAIRNPNVDIIAHPAGRYIGSRADLDLDWDAVFSEAARTGTALELNGSDERLDLSDVRARRAGRIRLRLHDRLGRAPNRGARQPPLGRRHGPPGLALARSGDERQIAPEAARVGLRQARASRPGIPASAVRRVNRRDLAGFRTMLACSIGM